MEIISREEARQRGAKYFFTGKPCVRGHLSLRYASSGSCKDCMALRNNLDYVENRQVKVDQATDYRRKNADKIRARDAERRERNKEKIKARDALYRSKNKAVISKRHVELRRRKRNSDPLFAIKHSIRGLIGWALGRRGYRKSTKTVQILGCTLDEFVEHIERQFLPGMSWDNRSEWHIDHIVPMATAKTEQDAISLNHVSNLRPMWGKENIQKSDKILFLI